MNNKHNSSLVAIIYNNFPRNTMATVNLKFLQTRLPQKIKNSLWISPIIFNRHHQMIHFSIQENNISIVEDILMHYMHYLIIFKCLNTSNMNQITGIRINIYYYHKIQLMSHYVSPYCITNSHSDINFIHLCCISFDKPLHPNHKFQINPLKLLQKFSLNSMLNLIHLFRVNEYQSWLLMPPYQKILTHSNFSK